MKFLQTTLVIASIAIANMATAQKVNLVLTKGQKISQETTIESKTALSVMGNDMENSVKSVGTTVLEVTEQTKDATDVKVSNVKAKLNMVSMGNDLDYDSEKKDKSPLSEGMSKIMGQSITATIDKNGTIVKETTLELDEMMKQLAASGAGLNLANANTYYIQSLIGKDIKVGFTWIDSSEIKGDQVKKRINNYTVKSIEGGIATLAISSVETTTGTMQQMGQEMGISGTTKSTGTKKVALSTGLLMESDLTSEINLNIDAQGMSIPITGSSKSKTVTNVN